MVFSSDIPKSQKAFTTLAWSFTPATSDSFTIYFAADSLIQIDILYSNFNDVIRHKEFPRH
ncbi:hypothetical protein DQC18_15845 [Salmonella enterica subsp. enterica serovar Newport]|nr:hypothetical protein [Salmonella enterica subsp. enterica serovar Newport]